LRESTVLIFEDKFDSGSLIRSNDKIISNVVNINSSESELTNEASLIFDISFIDKKYDNNKIWIAKLKNNQIEILPTFFDDDKLIAEITTFGKYVLIYNNKRENNLTLPVEFGINSCYPNPFNPSITIDYNINKDSNIELSVFNILGQKVKTIENSFKEKGRYSVIWNGRNNDDKLLPSGIYFIEINNFKQRDIIPVTLLK